MRLKKRLLVLVLVSALIVPGILSPVISVSAASSDLYGTGSADEINIIKILDMALNKAGMSMSPPKIRDFLNFWWQSVQSDIQTLLNDAGTTITTASDFVDYIASAASDPTKVDGLEMVDLTLKFARFCTTMEFKTLSDYKTLLTQEGTFRQFLLSYVADENGDVTGSVSNNKLAKYQLKSGFISMVRQAADCYIKEYEGYYLLPTFSYKDLSSSFFKTKENYDTTIDFLKNKLGNSVAVVRFSSSTADMVISLDGLTAVNTSYSRIEDGYFEVFFYDDNWTSAYPKYWNFSDTATYPLIDYPDNGGIHITYTKRYILYSSLGLTTQYYPVFTSDGRAIKIWKSLDAFKASSVGKSDIYYSKDYGTFEESKDTGLTFTGAYYNGSYSHDTIQNTIDNSETTIDNSTINNIVNNYITNNYGDGSGSGGAASGDGSGSSGGWWDIGSGISAFIEGIASLLDFLLKLLGDLIDVISEFLVGLLAVLERLGAVGSSFGDFLKVFFGFLPEEIIDMIVVSIGFIVVAGVIKMFKG